MKYSLLILSLFVSFSAFSKDMSETENWKDAYRELEDGSSEYIGSCSLHQDYEGKKFIVGETLVEYFEPGYDMTDAEFAEMVKNVEPNLLTEANKVVGADSLKDVDDITVEKIESTKVKGLDLYRLNIGVGGGNGMFLVFNRKANGQYEFLSQVFDGDVEYCDSLVWLK